MLTKTKSSHMLDFVKVQAKKKFGQNFLINEGVQKRFAEVSHVILEQNSALTKIIEVGPGMGAVTQHLVQLALPLEVYEIDSEAVLFLQNSSFANKLTIHSEDFLQIVEMGFQESNYLFVSNLPFNVGSRILVDLTLQDFVPPIVVVLQKEVIDKLLKKDGFSLFGGWLALFWDFTKIMDIAPGSFSPAPKVFSTLVSGMPYAEMWNIETRHTALNWLKKLIRYPSKSLRNNLLSELTLPQIEDLYLSLQLAETTRLNWENYHKILAYLLDLDIKKV